MNKNLIDELKKYHVLVRGRVPIIYIYIYIYTQNMKKIINGMKSEEVSMNELRRAQIFELFQLIYYVLKKFITSQKFNIQCLSFKSTFIA